MYEVILYAAIATIVCAMLYSVLGKSVGQDPTAGLDILTKPDTNPSEDSGFVPPVGADHKIPGINKIAAADRGFSPAQFTDGAKGAYSMILEAFASGDHEDLQALLTPSVYEVYAAAIKDRESRGLTQVTDLARLKSAEIVAAEKSGNKARISVQYEAEQSSALLDADGVSVEGDPDLLSNISEVWTFERDLKSNNPNWLLSDVAASTGDTMDVDTSPDTKA